jgi:RNA polymerase sigma-70 factor (ECF subfamily)
MLKIEEKTLKEASAATGMSIVALKVSTHRAVRNLRKILDRRSEHT